MKAAGWTNKNEICNLHKYNNYIIGCQESLEWNIGMEYSEMG